MGRCRIAVATIALLALGACENASPSPPVVAPPVASTPEGVLNPPRPQRKPPVPVSAPPADLAKPDAESPDRLIGLDQPATAALLGPPQTRTEAAPATIWRYTARNCELAIYFYLDLKSQVMRALQYEVKAHDLVEPTGTRCFAELLAEHQSDNSAPSGADITR